MSRYQELGVDYDILDSAKRTALSQARGTGQFLRAHGAWSVESSRGEPAFVFGLRDQRLAMVMECLGTKSIVCREYEDLTGNDLYANLAYDAVAAIVNDLSCVGAVPLVVNAYFATGSSAWFQRPNRIKSLAQGWRRACNDAGAAWGGGETPSLVGLIAEEEIELAGSALGYLPGGEPILGSQLAPGDEIVLLASTGIHANGLTLAREVVRNLPEGLLTSLPSGSGLGEALMVPSAIYAAIVNSLLTLDLPITYMSHITGHGLRKLMRANRDLTYRIEALLPVPEVLDFLVGRLGLGPAAAWGTFNMGVGFAVMCRPGNADEIGQIASGLGVQALLGGYVESGPRTVILEPLGVSYPGSALRLR